MVRLSERAHELALVEPQVEEKEKPWRELMAAERLNDIKRFVTEGNLLEIGCSTGEMLAAAGSSFAVAGVEADERNSLIARARGLSCFSGTLSDARFPDHHFDVVALYHVIEHFHSPRAELSEIRRVLKPGGLLVVETPNIETIWFHLLGARWRQFIPDHIFFFTPHTITQLCRDSGFEIRELRNVGKMMSLRLFVSRLGRYHRPTARLLTMISSRFDLNNRTLRLNLGDVMRVYAKKRMKDEG
jgi:SAM-dependent methyltransferase